MTDAGNSRKRWIALVFLCLAVWINAVDSTIVTVGLPAIGLDLGASNTEQQWILASFLIAAAGMVLFGAGLADRYGRKKLMALALVVFTAASVFAALGTTAGELIAARAIMGLGMGIVMPVSLALIAVLFPGPERKAAIGIWASISGLGVALGPVLGGVLTDTFGWNAIFWANVPVAVISLIGLLVVFAESKSPTPAPLDPVGGLLSVLGVGGVVFALIQGPDLGWLTTQVWVGGLIGVLCVIGLVLWELRRPEPMFDPRVLAIRPVAIGGLAVAMMYACAGAVFYLLPQRLQFGAGMSVSSVGWALLPVGLVFALATPVSPKLIAKVGSANSIAVGYFLMALGLAGMAFTPIGSYGVLLPCMVIFSLGWAAQAIPGTAIILEALGPKQAGAGSAVNQLSRSLGAAFGISIVGSIFTAVYASSFTAIPGVSVTDLDEASKSVSVAANVAETLPAPESTNLLTDAVDALGGAQQAGFAVMAGLALVTAILAFALLRSRPLHA